MLPMKKSFLKLLRLRLLRMRFGTCDADVFRIGVVQISPMALVKKGTKECNRIAFYQAARLRKRPPFLALTSQ